MSAACRRSQRRLPAVSGYLVRHKSEKCLDRCLHQYPPRGILNSFVIASSTALLITYFSALTAYGIHACNIKLKKLAFTFIMAVVVIPNQVGAVGF